MDPRYQIADTRDILSPGLVLFREQLEQNIDHMLRIAGSSERLRPHCKTHKMREVIELQLERGITRHKCATFAEAEMLAETGVKDICLAYNLVGPNIRRAVAFVTKYPDVTFSVTADHSGPISALGKAMSVANASIDVLLDLDTGQHRTGVPVGEAAKELYRQIDGTAGLRAGGFHVYDGQQHQTDFEERKTAVDAEWAGVIAFRDALLAEGHPVPRIVSGGTASFPIYAAKAKEDPAIECSPGTCVFNDAGYTAHFPDLVFPPAVLVLTRVVSRPTSDRVTVDLGYKAVASDPPAGSRVVFPDLPDAKQVLQNEEHLVLETERAAEFQPGDELLAIPRHICPTVALHQEVFVISEGRLADRWQVAARNRRLTI